MKIGDLVVHPRCPTLGVGLVTFVAEASNDTVKVLWSCSASSLRSNTTPTTEISEILEIVSASR